MAGNIIKLDSNTWRIEDGFVYYYLLTGENKALLIDSGVSSEDISDTIKEITDLPVILVNTHGDMDHVAGNATFSEFYLKSEDYNNRVLKEKFPNTKQIDVKEGDTFDLGKRVLEVIEIPGHTEGSIGLLDKKARIFYAGDTVQDSIIFMFGDHRRENLYAGSLKKIIERKRSFDRIRASHGTAELPANYTEYVLKDWEDVLEGRIEGRPQQLHGWNVKVYQGSHCGFYRDK